MDQDGSDMAPLFRSYLRGRLQECIILNQHLNIYSKTATYE